MRSYVDLGNTVRDEARLHDYSIVLSWVDVETIAAGAGYILPSNVFLMPLPMRGPAVRKALGGICDLKGVPYILRILNADACLSGQRVRVFSRQMSAESMTQLGIM